MNARNKILQKHGRTNAGTTPVASNTGAFKTKTKQKTVEPDPTTVWKMDYYNSDSMVKTTSRVFPDSWNTKQRLELPLSAIIQPFQQLDIPQYKDLEPFRCKKCKAFMSPFWNFDNNGQSCFCNLCGSKNLIEQNDKHFAPLNEDYLPINWEDRAELTSGAFEIKVGEEFSNNAPSDPTYLFVVDVTPEAINSGVTHTAFASIQAAVKDKLLNGGENARVGIICFDSKIHLITLDSISKKPRVITMVGNFDTCPIPFDYLTFTNSDFIDEDQFDMIGQIADCFDPSGVIGNSIPVKSLLLLANM